VKRKVPNKETLKQVSLGYEPGEWGGQSLQFDIVQEQGKEEDESFSQER
jgi:hypothetical protein